MPGTPEGLALLKTLDRHGVVAIDTGSPDAPIAERLHEQGLIRAAGPSGPEGRRQWVLSGRGLRLVRQQALAPLDL